MPEGAGGSSALSRTWKYVYAASALLFVSAHFPYKHTNSVHVFSVRNSSHKFLSVLRARNKCTFNVEYTHLPRPEFVHGVCAILG